MILLVNLNIQKLSDEDFMKFKNVKGDLLKISKKEPSNADVLHFIMEEFEKFHPAIV